MKERLAFEREIELLLPPDFGLETSHETAEGLRRKLLHLSFLPHFVRRGGSDVGLKPALVDPGIYDGPDKFKVAATDPLQTALMAVMGKREFSHIKVALADLTGKAAAPDFAGYFHKQQIFIASVAKLAPMVAAFQLRHDLRVLATTLKPATLAELFDKVRTLWAETQKDPGGKATPFSGVLQLRGALVLIGASKVPLKDPKAPRLETIFAPVAAGSPVTLEFASTGESLSDRLDLVDKFNLSTAKADVKQAQADLAAAQKAKPPDTAKITAARKVLADALKRLEAARKQKPAIGRKLAALGFLERLGIGVGGDVPASNDAVASSVRDIGYHYMASTLLQTGLYAPARAGGLWLGRDFAGGEWRGALAGGAAQSGTAGGLVALMVLLAQDALVSPDASREMRLMMQKTPNLTVPGTGSWFDEGLRPRPIRTLIAKVGLAAGGSDEIAYIERDIEHEAQNPDGSRTRKTTRICYAVAALRARNGGELRALIRELDRAILQHNKLPV